MSHHLTNLTWDLRRPRGNTKFVLLAMSHKAVQSTGEAVITTQDIAAMCGLSESCVRDHIEKLIELRYAARIETADGPGFRLTVAPRANGEAIG